MIVFHSLSYDFLALLAAPGVVEPVVRDLLLAGLAGFDGDGCPLLVLVHVSGVCWMLVLRCSRSNLI